MSLPAYRKPYSGQGSGEWNSPAAPGLPKGRPSSWGEPASGRKTFFVLPCWVCLAARVEQPTSEHVHENHKKTESPLEPGHAQPPARRSGRRLRDPHPGQRWPYRQLERRRGAPVRPRRERDPRPRLRLLSHPQDRDAGVPQQALRQADAEGRFETEGWRVRSNGKRFWAQVVIDAIRDSQGQLLGFAQLIHDLSEGRAARRRCGAARSSSACWCRALPTTPSTCSTTAGGSPTGTSAPSGSRATCRKR